MQWGRNDDLYLKKSDSVAIYSRRTRQYAVFGNLYAIQTSVDKIFIASNEVIFKFRYNIKLQQVTHSKNVIKKISVCDQAIGIWSGSQLNVLKLSKDSIDEALSATLEMERSLFVLHKSGIYVAIANALEVYNFSGVKKQTIVVHDLSITHIVAGSNILALVLRLILLIIRLQDLILKYMTFNAESQNLFQQSQFPI